ncbi:MAG TPA: alpha/beta fold hydrolase [Planctomycetota bacterium]
MPSERFTLPCAEPPLSAVLDAPAGAPRASAILLAHGAGYHMDSPWMERVALGLAAHGFPVLRFNYPYQERARARGHALPPDRQPVLEEAHAVALAALAERMPGSRILLAGKSMGGRIATYLAAKGERCAGLVLFGYPLHPPKQPARTRSEHFPTLAQPALFLQGTRDEFADLALLRAALGRYGGQATLEVIEGADHGFHVPRSSGTTDDQVFARLLERVSSWERATFPA